MVGRKNRKAISPQKSNFNRHVSQCSICAHPRYDDIERDFISWISPAKIATEYKLRDRSAVYRHALALDLGPRRDRNIRAALGRIIEKVDDVRATPGAVVQAIALYARMNARGELVGRDEQVGSHELFSKMNSDELKAYIKDGTLPSWFPRLNATKDPQGSGGDENE
jgi:hypothetical protein